MERVGSETYRLPNWKASATDGYFSTDGFNITSDASAGLSGVSVPAFSELDLRKLKISES